MLLHRDSPEPLYIQIKGYLVDEIIAGRYQPDQRLPSERELSELFDVGRMTVRQALQELFHEGKIYTRTGKGTFVQGPKIDQQLRALTGFSEEERIRGSHPSSRVLEAKITPAGTQVASVLRILPGKDVILLARLRLSNGIPLALESASLPNHLFPGLLEHDFAIESLYEVLMRDFGIRLMQAEQTLEAALASTYEAEMLGLKPPAAVLKMERLTHDQDGRIVEYVHSTYRGDRYMLRTVLQA